MSSSGAAKGPASSTYGGGFGRMSGGSTGSRFGGFGGASQIGAAPGQPVRAVPANPNAPVIFLVPTRGLGMNGLPKLVQLPSMYSVDGSGMLALEFFRGTRADARRDFL